MTIRETVAKLKALSWDNIAAKRGEVKAAAKVINRDTNISGWGRFIASVVTDIYSEFVEYDDHQTQD